MLSDIAVLLLRGVEDLREEKYASSTLVSLPPCPLPFH